MNVEAADLGLGSGGFDVVHVNLTRGLEAEGAAGEHVMKLNYTSLQHPVEPVEPPSADERALATPVLVLPLHGHLAPAAWAAGEARPGLSVGFVQAAGGALPGSLSRDVPELRRRGLLAGHVTAGPAYGGGHEAISLAGGIDAVGSQARLGRRRGRARPRDPRLREPYGPWGDGSPRRRPHGPCARAADAGLPAPLELGSKASPPWPLTPFAHRARDAAGAGARAGAGGLDSRLAAARERCARGRLAQAALDDLIEVCGGRHDIAVEGIDLDGYAASGLPARAMGRTIEEDPLFFAAPLAAGRALAEAVSPA